MHAERRFISIYVTSLLLADFNQYWKAGITFNKICRCCSRTVRLCEGNIHIVGTFGC